MRKLFFILAVCIGTLSVDAQVLRTEELEQYAKENYGSSWTDAAENLSKQLVLDKNYALTYSEVIECNGQTKEQL